MIFRAETQGKFFLLNRLPVLAVEAEVVVAGEGHVSLAVERELAPDIIRSYVR